MLCNKRGVLEAFGEFLVKEKSCKFTAFVNKVLLLGFAFIFSILSLISLTFPAAKHTS